MIFLIQRCQHRSATDTRRESLLVTDREYSWPSGKRSMDFTENFGAKAESPAPTLACTVLQLQLRLACHWSLESLQRWNHPTTRRHDATFQSFSLGNCSSLSLALLRHSPSIIIPTDAVISPVRLLTAGC